MKSCATCRRSDGKDGCRDSLKDECCEGGGFEAWKPKKLFVDVDHFMNYINTIGYKGAFSAKNYGGRFYVEYKGEFTVD